MPRKKKSELPLLIVPKNATLRQIYAAARKQFTAADLQKFTVEEPMVEGRQLLAECTAIHEQETRKRKEKRQRK